MTSIPISRLLGILIGAGTSIVLITSASSALSADPAAAATSAEGTVLPAPPGVGVKGEYIVTLKDETQSRAATERTARDLSAKGGGKLRRTYSNAVRGFAASMTEKQAKALAADPAVESVEQDALVSMSAAETAASWGLDRIDQRALPLDGTYNAGSAPNVTAYMLDTGLRITHKDFGGRAGYGYDFVDDDAVSEDCYGHGTHVAGIAGGSTYGVAKGLKLVGVRVLDCEGYGRISDVIAGVDWVTQNAVKPAVANMSLNAKVSRSLDRAVKNSIKSGVTYVVAAGNDSADACGSSPARLPEAITVGATLQNDARAEFSNFGTCVDVFAPGMGITSTFNTSDDATDTWGGTSMAAPHVLGVAALYLAAHPTATPDAVTNAILGTATTGLVTAAGLGSPLTLICTLTSGSTAGSAGTPTTITPPSTGLFENKIPIQIPDTNTWLSSTIAVAGITGNAPAALKVTVNIRHPYRGDLVIDLVAPNGTSFRLKNASAADSGNGVKTTYTVNAAQTPAAGTWTLKIRDTQDGDAGRLNAWSLQL